MRTRTLMRSLLTIALLLSASASIRAQGEKKEKVIVPMKAGYFVSFTTTPASSVINKEGFSTNFAEAYFSSNTIRRVLVDREGSLYFGYALVIEPILQTKQFKVSVRPLSPEDEQELRTRKSFQTRRLHPNYNAAMLTRSSTPQVISDGDTFALDVLVNPLTGDKITDIVTISTDRARLEDAPVSETPRDFTLEDVEMRMIDYRLLINGELAAVGKQSGACAGALIWFHLPERGGRLIFSVMPHAGYDFQKIGTIEGNKIKFTLNGDQYEWISNTPIVGNGGYWNLYVLYDKAYIPDPFLLGVGGEVKMEQPDKESGLSALEKIARRPRGSGTSGFGVPSETRQDDKSRQVRQSAHLIIGAADRIENLLPKK
ncbi:MAG: hypothetical protein DMF68_16350 [Acidobacteria bacterium]|nr:MAG: hypothetical protein DMF68_16350 [Acidobacteriota bacterium]